MRRWVVGVVLGVAPITVSAMGVAAIPWASQRSPAWAACALEPAAATANRPAMGATRAPQPPLQAPTAVPLRTPATRARVRSAPLMASAPLVGSGSSNLRLKPNIPYWRLGLSGACAIAAISQHGTSEKVGWTMLGGGLLTWALVDWFVPALRSKAAE